MFGLKYEQEFQGYAMTESTCVGAISPADEIDAMEAHFGSVGTLTPNVEAMVIDPATNKPMPPTKQGELWIRGPSVMKGATSLLSFAVKTLKSAGNIAQYKHLHDKRSHRSLIRVAFLTLLF